MLLAASIAQGGCGFPYFHKSIYRYLCGHDPIHIDIDYSIISDRIIKELLAKVCVI